MERAWSFSLITQLLELQHAREWRKRKRRQVHVYYCAKAFCLHVDLCRGLYILPHIHTQKERKSEHFGYIHKVNTPCKRLKRHHIIHSLPTNNRSIEPVIISYARDYHAPLCHCQSLLFGSLQTPQTLPSERERT